MRIRTALAAIALASSACVHGARTGAGPDTFDLVVAATTDVHGRVRGWNYESGQVDSARGLARAATIVDSLRRSARGRLVLIDAGDHLQGNSLTYVAARVASMGAPHPVIAAMNAMGYDAAVIGNHEFNYGVPFLERAIKQAKFPILAANAVRPDGSAAFLSWTLIERGGARIGVVGATTPGSMLWDRDNLKGRLVIHDIVPDVRAAVADVRGAGADVVLVALHSGLDEPASYDTVSTGLPSENVAARVAREVPGIDLVLFGHSHKELRDTLINGVLLVQPKYWATSVSVAHLLLSRERGRWHVASKEASLVQAAGHGEDPAVLAASDAAHRATVAWVTTPIGRTPVAWRADSARVVDTPLIDFITEVERRAAGADLASTAAFSLDATLDTGAITAARLQALYPYDNTLRAIRISGRQLREYLEHSARYYVTVPDGRVTVDPTIPGYNFDIVSGVDYTLDLTRPAGQRVTRLDFHGKPVAPSDSFTMALNNYRQNGGGGFAMLTGAPVVYDKQQEIRQLLVDEVRRKGTIVPSDYFHPNWRLEPASAVSSLYQELRGNVRDDAGGAAPIAPPAAKIADTVATRATRPAPRLRIIATNDFHGALEPRPDTSGKRRGGAAHLATALTAARAGCVSPACEVILVDAGDEFQGTPASNLAFGRPVVAIFNELGYVAAALGNHEFDWGQDTLRARMRDARYGMFAANVRYADGRAVPWVRDDTLVTRGALKIGLIGVATVATPRTTRASNVADLRFLDPAPIVDSLSRRLRRRGADYVVVLAHAGAFCDQDGASNCKGEVVDFARHLREPVDAIVGGHSHTLIDAAVDGVPVVQARSRGRAYAVVDLAPGGSVHRVLDVLTDSIPADPRIDSLVRHAVRRVAPFANRPVAAIARDLLQTGTEYGLGNLVADAMRSAGKGDVAIVNNGGIRAALRRGQATYGSLFEVLPFSNQLARITLTGTALRTVLERRVAPRPNVHVSGVTVTYDSTRAAGSRIVSVRMRDGSALRDDARYAVVVPDFFITGGDGVFGRTPLETRLLPIVDLDALVAYLRSRPQPVQPPTDARFIAVAGR